MKQLIKNYSFNATSKTVTLTDFTTVVLERVQVITDVTTNAILYNFADNTVATASVATNVITLSTVGTASNTDKLMIIYDAAAGDPTYDGTYTTTFSTTTAQAVATTDAIGFRYVSLQVTSQGTTATHTVQVSNDGTTWVSALMSPSTNVSNAMSSVVSTVGVYSGPLTARYYRINVTGITAGTSAGTLVFYDKPSMPQTIGVGAQQIGTWNIGGSGSIALSDTMTNPATNNTIGSFVGVFNGTTWERGRSANAAANTAGTGLLGEGVLGFDGTNYQRLKVDTSGILQVSASSAINAAYPTNALPIGLTDGTNLRPWIVASGAADGTIGNSIAGVGSYVFNGTTFDRQRAANAASNTTGTGLLGTGNMVFDGTNWQAARSATSDAATASTVQETVHGLYNGSTIDRARSSGITGVAAVGGVSLEVTGSAGILNADMIASTDVTAYSWVSVQTLGTFSGTLSFQGSNDNTNWVAVALNNTANVTSAPSITTGAAAIYFGPVNTKYFRVRMTSYTSGTATGIAEFSTQPTGVNSIGVAASQSGTYALGMSTTSTGALTMFFNSGLSNTATQVKSGATRLGTTHFYNPNNSGVFIQLFNLLSASVTLGTTTPSQAWYVPAGGVLEDAYAVSLNFSTGLTIAATTTATGNTAPTSGIVTNLGYN